MKLFFETNNSFRNIRNINDLNIGDYIVKRTNLKKRFKVIGICKVKREYRNHVGSFDDFDIILSDGNRKYSFTVDDILVDFVLI